MGMKKRIQLIVAYDGTSYCGWQIQPNGMTIEEQLNTHLSHLTGESIRVIGASRTDAGVHARCNIAVFDTCTTIPPERISYALNQRLPEDIRIQESKEVSLDFHPRYCKSIKTYRYTVQSAEFPMPIGRQYIYDTDVKLNVDHMRKGAEYLIGEHDFKSFCANDTNVTTTVRTIENIQILEENGLIIIQVSGYGFLYNMVRIIAGTLLKVGGGVWQPEEVGSTLERKDRRLAGPTAPAKGLMLYSYEFLV